MKNLLIPVDGLNTARTHAALAEAVRLWGREPATVHLLSVQPPVSEHVAMFFGKSELYQLQEQAGLRSWHQRALLDQAGMSYTSTVRVGRQAETIARAARELGCDGIVMGQESGARFASRMMGSVTEQVRQIVPPAECQVIGS